ncbi:MAG: hypothetical protein LH650_00115 [Chloroflexi bacterium]|nr:hypothetical protein [Chloroflexota bacterium]
MRARRSIALGAAVLALVAFGGPVAASGPSVTVEPNGPLPAGTQTVTVTGSGFDPVGNRGNGVYVVFGPITPAPGYYIDPSVYAVFKWVHATGQASGAEAPLAADGSFSTTLDIPSTFTNQVGPVDCAVLACAVITFGAHGSQDRSQDTCTAVTFVADGATASVTPAASGAPDVASLAPASPAPSTPAASAAPAPSASTDPCAAMMSTSAP